MYTKEWTATHNTTFQTGAVSLTNVGYLGAESLVGITIVLRDVAEHSDKTNGSGIHPDYKKGSLNLLNHFSCLGAAPTLLSWYLLL
jgi:hypothetical protein